MNSENSLYSVEKNLFKKKIEIPSSKSYANRALILGALIGNNFKVSNIPKSSDVLNLINCLRDIGLEIDSKDSEVVFRNSFPACEKNSIDRIVLTTGDGGTTNRFLLALLALGKNSYELIPSEKMNERPMSELVNVLTELGVTVDVNLNNSWIVIKGPMNLSEKKQIEIDCGRSTQFASALKLVLFNQKIKITLKNLNASEDYIYMTEKVIHEASRKNEIKVPVDFSSLGYPAALAAISGEVLIRNCTYIDDFQADSILVELLEESGAIVDINENGLYIKNNGKLKAFKIDGSDCPDLIMTLSFLASYSEGMSIIQGVSILRHKESDRLDGMINLLKEFNIQYEYEPDEDYLKIFGGSTILDKKELIPARDHRMVMVSYLYLRANAGGSLHHIDCINKSFPDFIKIME